MTLARAPAATPEPPSRPGASRAGRWFLGSDVYRRRAFGDNHPLAIPRIPLVIDLCRALGWLDAARYVESPRASPAALARFHLPEYVDAVRRVSRTGRASSDDRRRRGLGTRENPVFDGLFERATTACGGSIRAAELVLDGGVAFNPAGGTHHGLRDRAHGFCYFNDPVLAILALLDAGLARVLYLDLDAHHGDGVEIAFNGEPRVLAISVHEQGRWPHSGRLEDRAGGSARNLPVPAGFHDAELAFLMAEAVAPLARRFEPEAVVITAGADALAGDPLSRLALSNRGLWRAVETACDLSPRTVVLGGGGYNPWTLARAWAGLWGVLCGAPTPERLPPAAAALLSGLECALVDEDDVRPEWLATLADPPDGERAVRREVAALARAALA